MSKHPLYNTTGFQRDNKSHVMYALASKQMELIQVQKEYEVKISKIKSDLTAMEQVICLFDGDCANTIEKIRNKVKISKPKSATSYTIFFERGELKKLILKVIRTSPKSMKTDEITDEIIRIKELKNDRDTTYKVQKSVVNQVSLLENSSLLERDGKEGLSILWKIRD